MSRKYRKKKKIKKYSQLLTIFCVSSDWCSFQQPRVLFASSKRTTPFFDTALTDNWLLKTSWTLKLIKNEIKWKCTRYSRTYLKYWFLDLFQCLDLFFINNKQFKFALNREMNSIVIETIYISSNNVSQDWKRFIKKKKSNILKKMCYLKNISKLYITIHKSRNIILKSILQINFHINTLYIIMNYSISTNFIFVFTFHIARHFLDFANSLMILC